MDKKSAFILWFDQLTIDDVGLTGGKNASLGEMYKNLTPKGVSVPNGFAVTAHAYFYLLEKAGIKDKIKEILTDLDTRDISNLQERGQKVRHLIREAEFSEELKNAIFEAYSHLCIQYGENTDVAVRSSATAEDLPDASFAGQQETYLNIRGNAQLLEACKKCFASLFTDRAISYRQDKGFDHFSIGLSIGVQKMVRSDLACSGVMFSIDTESGFKDAVLVTGAYGLGENVVQGAVNPDEFYVFKPTLRENFRPIIHKAVGAKHMKMIYDLHGSKHTKNVPVNLNERKKFVLSEDEILQLAKWAMIIEDHYSEKAGHFKPMDMEWAKDGKTGQLFIVQARPETVHSQKDCSKLITYKLEEKGKILSQGKSVGSLIGQGKTHVIKDVHQIHDFKKGEVLVTEMTDPDWEPIMKIAAAIVTNRGGRTCFTEDTILLTNKGFMSFGEVYNSEDELFVPSLNRESLKIEWKEIRARMKRKGNVIKADISQTGRMRGNSLKLTKDHKVLTYENRDLVSKEIQNVLRDEEMVLLAQRIPRVTDSTEHERKLAYLMGAISTDGSVYLTKRRGEVQLIQKPSEEKKEFIETFCNYMGDVFDKKVSVSVKKPSSGLIRGKPAKGNANAYRFYGKQIAQQITMQKQKLVTTLLSADEEVILYFLAGVIDGDGSYNHVSNRINIYCSNKPLLQAITVGCLRLGTVPQVTVNRNIYNIQIVELVKKMLSYTKRVKGTYNRKNIGTRFFSAKQLLGNIGNSVNFKGRIKAYMNNNLLLDAEKIKKNVLHLCNPQEKEKLRKIMESDTRMQRTSFNSDLGIQDVYNIEVKDNHNYIVFTERYSPVLVNNCHAAIISRELGIPCLVGCETATDDVASGKDATVDCSEGEDGFVYEGLLKFKKEEVSLESLPRTKTKIMMNLASPEQAFPTSFIPNSGVGLAREEFVINSYIKIHPLALLHFDKVTDAKVRKQIQELTFGYENKADYFVDNLARGVAMITAAFYPKPVIIRLSDFKTNEYANLIGGTFFEPKEDNPMIGWRGSSRYYSAGYKDGFALECKALKRVREEFGLTNLEVMIPFCRTVDEGKRVLATMKEHGLKRGENGLRVICMCEIPSNVILAEEFLEIFDGFSIGSNDLTQLTLGLDRDSELVADLYDERNEAVKKLIKQVIEVCNKKGKYIGFCGQAVSDFVEMAEFVVEAGIQSMSLNPDTVIKTTMKVAEVEKKLGISPK